MYNNYHLPWDLSDERRNEYSLSSKASHAARKRADALVEINPPSELSIKYDPNSEMPRQERNGRTTLSLFSGGGGLDLGFDLAGFDHFSSYELLPFAGATLQANRPKWDIFSGESGDVERVDWKKLHGRVDVIHGGPPCQPFSIAGRRAGSRDSRDMFPEFVRAVDEIEPVVFVVENVLGFLSAKFESYRKSIIRKLSRRYNVKVFILSSADFGVPQERKRVFIVGSLKKLQRCFDSEQLLKAKTKRGVRSALGLRDIEVDGYAPTLRCTLTGPRQTDVPLD